MKVKTNQLKGSALDYTVARLENSFISMDEERNIQCYLGNHPERYFYSSCWCISGPFIQRKEIDLSFDISSEGSWCYASSGMFRGQGDTPLIAAMRCYVTSKLGDEVEVPEAFREVLL